MGENGEKKTNELADALVGGCAAPDRRYGTRRGGAVSVAKEAIPPPGA